RHHPVSEPNASLLGVAGVWLSGASSVRPLDVTDVRPSGAAGVRSPGLVAGHRGPPAPSARRPAADRKRAARQQPTRAPAGAAGCRAPAMPPRTRWSAGTGPADLGTPAGSREAPSSSADPDSQAARLPRVAG